MATVSERVERLEAEAWRRYVASVARWVGVDAAALQAEWERDRATRAEIGERAARAALAADIGVPVDDLLPLLEEVQAAHEAGLPYESVVWHRGGATCRA